MNINIFVGTPCYGGKLDLDFFNSILNCHAHKLPISVMGLRNESLITRGRNTIFSYFMYLTQFTHLLFIDADVGFTGDDIIKLFSHKKDVIGAAVRLKGNDPSGNPAYNVYPRMNISSGEILQKVDRVGTAIFCLSRKACEDLAKNAPVYKPSNMTRGQALPIEKCWDVFRTGVVNGEYLSEDYWVCNDLKNLGYDVWVDWSIKTRHWGVDVYE